MLPRMGDVVLGSFVSQSSYSYKFSASDVCYGVSALLNFRSSGAKGADKAPPVQESFLKALDSLSKSPLLRETRNVATMACAAFQGPPRLPVRRNRDVQEVHAPAAGRGARPAHHRPRHPLLHHPAVRPVQGRSPPLCLQYWLLC